MNNIRLHFSKNIYVFFLFTLILLTRTQLSSLLPYTIWIGGFGFYQYDIITILIFFIWIKQYFFGAKLSDSILYRVNKYYILFLLLGCIPVLFGFLKDKPNLFAFYRYFFYFVWVPVLIQFLEDPKWSKYCIHILIIVNVVSVGFALIQHFNKLGLELYYLDINKEANLFILMVLISLLLSKKYFFNSPILTFLLFSISVLALIIDRSRKMYMVFLFGCTFIFLFQLMMFKKRKHLFYSELFF